MSTRTANLPIERRYLVRAYLFVTVIVIAAATVVAIAVTFTGGQTAGEGQRTNVTGQLGEVADYGPPTSTHGPIVVNGSVCGQCR